MGRAYPRQAVDGADSRAAEQAGQGPAAGRGERPGQAPVTGPGRLLTIGELAAETGVPGSTIRFWERKGLLSPTLRQSGQRRYARSSISSVAMLRLCQEAGFTLADIRRLIDERKVTPRSWRGLVRGKLADVERQITALEHARGLLTHALACHHDDLLACPAFQEWFAAYPPNARAAAPPP